jgi:hypothetical protein
MAREGNADEILSVVTHHSNAMTVPRFQWREEGSEGVVSMGTDRPLSRYAALVSYAHSLSASGVVLVVLPLFHTPFPAVDAYICA